MASANSSAPPPRPRTSRVDTISDSLRQTILSGTISPGERLPSELELSRLHSVSRTVVREAIATLRSERLVDVRKGAGVFALEPPRLTSGGFGDLDSERISSVIELLELRTACEIEAAALAAARRSPVQLEDIHRAHAQVIVCLRAEEPTREADFQFHLAIAHATQNRRFAEFLQLIRTGIIARGPLIGTNGIALARDFNKHVVEEHLSILDAIAMGDSKAACERMRDHLRGSMSRYQMLLRQQVNSKESVETST
ncbi:FadR/GntR family transcriptional regulator [Brucellaceae bacterium D45D]